MFCLNLKTVKSIILSSNHHFKCTNLHFFEIQYNELVDIVLQTGKILAFSNDFGDVHRNYSYRYHIVQANIGLEDIVLIIFCRDLGCYFDRLAIFEDIFLRIIRIGL